jgi:cbb3-type cytochrome oxidase maturation protein
MSMLYVLIPLALMLLAVAAWALIWAIRSGQFDDLESHGWSVVLDDDQRPPPDPQGDQDVPVEAGEARDEKPVTKEGNTS